MLRIVFSSRIIRRNVFLLLLLSAILALPFKNSAQGSVYLISSFSGTDFQLDTKASVNRLGVWNVAGFIYSDYYYAWADSYCANTIVSQTATVDGVELASSVTGGGISIVLANGFMRRGKIGSYWLSIYTGDLLNVDDPGACYRGSDPGGGGDPPPPPPPPPPSSGCDYCAANWEYTAACSGPYDHDYCGPLL